MRERKKNQQWAKRIGKRIEVQTEDPAVIQRTEEGKVNLIRDRRLQRQKWNSVVYCNGMCRVFAAGRKKL